MGRKIFYIIAIVIAIILIAIIIIPRGNINVTNIYDATIYTYNRIGNTINTVAIAYLKFDPIMPNSLSISNLNIYLNESKMNCLRGDYQIHYPIGNGISQTIGVSSVWFTNSSGNGYIAVFPFNNSIIKGSSTLDIVYANISLKGNVFQLSPANFSLDSWIGVGIGVGYSGYSYIATTVITLTNYVDGMWLDINYWTDYKGNEAIFHITTKNYTYNNGHVKLPFDFKIVDINYNVLLDYMVNSFNSPSEITNSVPSQYNFINSSLVFNCLNNTEFGYGDSLTFYMNFSKAPSYYNLGNEWIFQICYNNQIVVTSTISPP